MNHKTIEITEGTKSDLPRLLELIQELADFEKAPESVSNTVSQMLEEWEHFSFIMAKKGERVIGMAVYFFAYSTWVGKSLYLDDLYVQSDCRGMGVGKQLLHYVLSLAWKENCHRVRWQVLDWNKPAIAFYEHIGAEIAKEWYNCDMDRNALKNYFAQANE